MRKKISDKNIILQNEEAETAMEIMKERGYRSIRQVYAFLDSLSAQGVKIAHCKVWRENRAGVMTPVPGYYIEEE